MDEAGRAFFLQERKPHLPQQPWLWIMGGHIARSPGETEPGTTDLTPAPRLYLPLQPQTLPEPGGRVRTWALQSDKCWFVSRPRNFPPA